MCMSFLGHLCACFLSDSCLFVCLCFLCPGLCNVDPIRTQCLFIVRFVRRSRHARGTLTSPHRVLCIRGNADRCYDSSSHTNDHHHPFVVNNNNIRHHCRRRCCCCCFHRHESVRTSGLSGYCVSAVVCACRLRYVRWHERRARFGGHSFIHSLIYPFIFLQSHPSIRLPSHPSFFSFIQFFTLLSLTLSPHSHPTFFFSFSLSAADSIDGAVTVALHRCLWRRLRGGAVADARELVLEQGGDMLLLLLL